MAQGQRPFQGIVWIVGLASIAGTCSAQTLLKTNTEIDPWSPRTRTPEAIAGPLISDRPGFSEGTNVLARGVLQMESGFSLTTASSRHRTVLLGQPLLRLGLGRRTELRLSGDGVQVSSQRTGAPNEAGMSDFSMGAKVRLFSEKGVRPAVTLVPSISLPCGHSSATSSTVDPTVKLAWSKTLTDSTAAAGNFNLSTLTDRGGRYVQSAMSFQIIRPVWRKWGGFWEAYRVSSGGGARDALWTFDTGVSRPIGRNLQVDVSAGQQVMPVARSWFVAAGVVVRRPDWLSGVAHAFLRSARLP